MAEEKDKLSRTTKLIAAVTALLVAIGTLVGAISVTLGGGGNDKGYSYTTFILDSQEAYDKFLSGHPG